jgi:lipoprotein-anchoring transpeptidase ErfK/SrfK
LNRLPLTLSILFSCLVAGLFAAVAFGDDTPVPPPTGTTTATTTTTTTTAATPAVIPPGVTIGGAAVGGMTPDAAVAAVRAWFGRPVLLRLARTTISVTPELVGTTVVADNAVAKALTVAPNTSLGLRASVNKDLVNAFASKLVHRFTRKAVDSRLLLRNFKPVVTQAVPGRRVDGRATVRALSDRLVHGTRAPLELPVVYSKPTVTEKSLGPVIVIRRSANRLTLYDGAHAVRQFAVATGQSVYPTPLGRFDIVVKWKNPWWYPPNSPWAQGEKPVPPGPGNPLGTRWMGISSPGVGIHGTPNSSSIGYSLSHGCVRMLIPQAEWLFDHVDIGTPVFIVAS